MQKRQVLAVLSKKTAAKLKDKGYENDEENY